MRPTQASVFRAAAIAVILSSDLLAGAAKAASANVAGIGFMRCDEALPLFDQRPYRDAFQSWTLGFASGLNTLSIIRDRHFRDLIGVEADSVLGSLRLFCTDNPTATVVQGAEKFWLDRPSRVWQRQ